MALDPETDVATALATVLQLPAPPIGQVTLTSGVNLFRGPLRDADDLPAQCVFVHCPDGAQPVPFLDGGVQSTFTAYCHVIVRSHLEAYAEGQALARACLRRVHLLAPYTTCEAMVSEPVYDQWRQTGSHVWRIPLSLSWVEDVALP